MAKGKKTGGRVKGTPNKRTQTLANAVAEEFPNYCPVKAMIRFALDENNQVEEKSLVVTCHKEVAAYLYPKNKSVEVTQSYDESALEWLEQVDRLCEKIKQIEIDED